jgi:hypothetical protein
MIAPFPAAFRPPATATGAGLVAEPRVDAPELSADAIKAMR